jgi:hypothetical protein
MATMNTKQIHYWQFDGDDTVYSAPEWRLESAIMETRHKLGLPIWQSFKILKNYAPVNTNPTTATDSSSVSNPSEPKLVSKRTRSRKVKQETTKLQSLPNILDESDNSNPNEEYLRDRTDRPTHPLSNGLD